MGKEITEVDFNRWREKRKTMMVSSLKEYSKTVLGRAYLDSDMKVLDLATRVSADANKVQIYLKNRGGNHSIEFLVELADALDCDIHEVIEDYI